MTCMTPEFPMCSQNLSVFSWMVSPVDISIATAKPASRATCRGNAPKVLSAPSMLRMTPVPMYSARNTSSGRNASPPRFFFSPLSLSPFCFMLQLLFSFILVLRTVFAMISVYSYKPCKSIGFIGIFYLKFL